MDADFPTQPLGSLAEVRARIGWRGLSASEYTSSGPYLIAGKHIVSGQIEWDACDHISEARYRESWEIALKPGDVVLSKDGTIGRVARIDRLSSPATLNGTMMLVRPRSGLDYRFLFHFLGGASFKKLIADKVSGSSIPHIFQRDLVTLPIVLPSPGEQRRIAEILDTLDEAIRKTEQLIAKLKQVKQGLLYDLLTRGIDDNGELREPERHPEQFKDSALGRLPASWRVCALGEELLGIDAGWSPSCIECPPAPGAWGVLKVSAVTGGVYAGTESKTLPTHLAPRPELEVHPGDVLLARANGVADLVGVTVEVVSTTARLMLSDKLLRLRPDPRVLVPGFMARMMAFASTRRQIDAMLSGSSGQKNISQAFIRQILVPIPPVKEQSACLTVARGLEGLIVEEERHQYKLRLLKRGLMEDLLTGRVRVKSAQIENVA